MQTALFLAWLGSAGVLSSPPPTSPRLLDPEPMEQDELDADEADATDEPEERPEIAEALAQRRDLRIPHIIAGNATFGSMTGTFIFGWMHFADLYGYSGAAGDAGCARGEPILGTQMCQGPVWPHLIGSIVATTAFSTAFLLSVLMPDPVGLAEQDSSRADWLTVHRVLRWGLLGLLIAQVALGVVTSTVELDSFDDQRNLAIAHLALGSVTYAALIPLSVTGWLLAWG
jgi:hypothetical protein